MNDTRKWRNLDERFGSDVGPFETAVFFDYARLNAIPEPRICRWTNRIVDGVSGRVIAELVSGEYGE